MRSSLKLLGWKRGLAIAGLVCFIPLMPEVLLLLDVVGLEATVFFLLLYAQTIVQDLAGRASYAYYFFESKVQSSQFFQPVSYTSFGFSTVASVLVLFVTGSLAFAICTWSPLLLTGSRSFF